MGPGDVSPQAFVTTEIWLEFGDGLYLFKLKLLQLAELQEKCNAGIGTIYARVTLGDYHVLDLFETIRLGLIGGSKGVVNEQEITVSNIAVKKLIERYCTDRPLDELRELAASILGACVVGYARPEDKKPGNEQSGTTDLEPTGSTSPPPMPTELPAEGLAQTT